MILCNFDFFDWYRKDIPSLNDLKHIKRIGHNQKKKCRGYWRKFNKLASLGLCIMCMHEKDWIHVIQEDDEYGINDKCILEAYHIVDVFFDIFTELIDGNIKFRYKVKKTGKCWTENAIIYNSKLRKYLRISIDPHVHIELNDERCEFLTYND